MLCSTCKMLTDFALHNFSTYQYSASVNGWKKYYFHGMGILRQGVLKSGCSPCAWRVLEHSRSIMSTRLISLDLGQIYYPKQAKMQLEEKPNTSLCRTLHNKLVYVFADTS